MPVNFYYRRPNCELYKLLRAQYFKKLRWVTIKSKCYAGRGVAIVAKPGHMPVVVPAIDTAYCKGYLIRVCEY